MEESPLMTEMSYTLCSALRIKWTRGGKIEITITIKKHHENIRGGRRETSRAG